MTRKFRLYRLYTALLLCLIQTAGIAMYGQDAPRAASKRMHRLAGDSTQMVRAPFREGVRPLAADSLLPATPTPADSLTQADSIAAENQRKMLEMAGPADIQVPVNPTDSLPTLPYKKVWVPNPTTATWLALVIPGGGQIYNRKFWKLPIFYGGFAGCAYALTWNGKMYKDYSQAYRDAVNNNWGASSIQDLLPPGYIDRVSKTQLTETLRKRKDTYRRYRDLSIFAFIGVYLLSVVDAYVDAELSNFDISPDLSMRVGPTVISNQNTKNLSGQSVGVQCSFRF